MGLGLPGDAPVRCSWRPSPLWFFLSLIILLTFLQFLFFSDRSRRDGCGFFCFFLLSLLSEVPTVHQVTPLPSPLVSLAGPTPPPHFSLLTRGQKGGLAVFFFFRHRGAPLQGKVLGLFRVPSSLEFPWRLPPSFLPVCPTPPWR